MRGSVRLVASATLAAGLVCVLIGCTTEAGTHAVPDQSKPEALTWAVEFEQARLESSSYERRILADDRITAAELNDSHDHVRSCMADSGFDLTWSDDGSYEVTPAGGGELSRSVDARLERARTACLDRWDHSVTYLYTQVRRNPEREDEAEIAVACLRQAGIVDSSYTPRTWRRDDESGVFPFDEYAAGAVQCRLDPLGLWRDG